MLFSTFVAVAISAQNLERARSLSGNTPFFSDCRK